MKQIELNNFAILNINTAHTFEILKLPAFHKDPFDRMLVAQAICENMIIITDDLTVKKYHVATI